MPADPDFSFWVLIAIVVVAAVTLHAYLASQDLGPVLKSPMGEYVLKMPRQDMGDIYLIREISTRFVPTSWGIITHRSELEPSYESRPLLYFRWTRDPAKATRFIGAAQADRALVEYLEDRKSRPNYQPATIIVVATTDLPREPA